MLREKNEIKQTIKKIAKDCTQVHEVYEDLGNTYERISNLPGKGYEKKYDLMTVIGAKSEYTKRFTVKNDFGGKEDIELVMLRSEDYKRYFVVLCGFQGNRMTRIDIFNCGGRD